MAFIDDLMGNTSRAGLPSPGGSGPLGGTPYPGGERPGTYGVDPGALDFSQRPRPPRTRPPSDGRGNWKPPGGWGAGGATPPPADPAPPPGFTPEQWAKLLKMAKRNPKIAELIKKYTDAAGQQGEEDKWRRVMPTDTSQLLKQLSYNAGEMGMPGGYVGAIQLPAYGETQPPVNNPDMSKYGQAKGLGEATFYQQSMNGGMAPIAAMSPLGVPEGWNPGGSSSTADELKKYLDRLGNGGGNGNGGARMSTKDQFQADFEAFVKAGLGGGNNGRVFAAFPGGFRGGTAIGGGKRKGKGGGGNGTPPTTTEKPGVGVPISLPFGF